MTPGTTVFYLVTGFDGLVESPLGFDSFGNLRLNGNACGP